MTREFLTYLPIWMPMQTRRHLLWRQVSSTLAQYWFNLMTDTSSDAWAAAPGSEDEKADNARFIYAYARDSDHAFAVDNLQWQLAWAYNMGEMLNSQLHANQYLRADGKSVYEVCHLDVNVTGIHHADRRLKFQWVEVICSIDLDMVWDYMKARMDLVETVYNRRWGDDRYAFATPEDCPIPRSLEDIQDMPAFNMGMLLEVVLWRAISRWSWRRSRDCSYWNIRHLGCMERDKPLIKLPIGAALQLKPALKQNALNGPYTDQIHALALEAIDEHQQVTNHSFGPYHFVYSRLSSTIIEKMDQLVEEMSNETQCQRQQGQICESEGSLHEPEASAD